MAEVSAPVGYMERTRLYYEAQGFEKPYKWAQHASTPFTAPVKSLADSRVAIVTTAATYSREQSDPRFVDSAPTSSTPSKMYANDLAWDKDATHLDDVDSFLPLTILRELEASGTIGSLAPRFHCVPTEYSQRRTREVDAPEVLKQCREDQADIALLIPL